MSTTARKITRAQTNKYAVQGKRAKDALSRDEQDLYELCGLSGVQMSPAVFRIVHDLLKMNVSPIGIVQMLKSVVHRGAKVSIPTDSLLRTSTATMDSSRNTTTSSGISSFSKGTSESTSKQQTKTSAKPARARVAGKTTTKT